MRRALATLAIVLGLAGVVRAESDDEVAARHLLIALRVLAYDRALADRVTGSDIVVVVIHADTDAGRADRDRWLAGFALVPNVKVSGKPVRAMAIALDDKLDANLAASHPALAIVSAGITDIKAIRRATRAHHVLSFSLRDSDARDGLSVAYRERDDGNELLVNLDASRAEGVRFAAGLLQSAHLVEEGKP